MGRPEGSVDLARPEGAAANHRNGKSAKTVLTDAGALRIDIPRDHAGTFEPQLIGKHERRFTGVDDKIVAMYASGMTVREIQGFLAEMYSVDVSPELISRITDAVMSEVTAWQTRPLTVVSNSLRLPQRRIVGIPARVAAEERAGIGLIHRRVGLQALDEIRVRQHHLAIGFQVGQP